MKTTWLRFRRAESRHAITGGTQHHFIIACGITHARTTGELDPKARKCGACRRAMRAAK